MFDSNYAQMAFNLVCRHYVHFPGYHPLAHSSEKQSRTVIKVSKRVICTVLMFLFAYVIVGPTLAKAAGDQTSSGSTVIAEIGAGGAQSAMLLN